MDRIGDMDRFMKEVEEFIEDDVLKDNQDLPFDKFWKHVKGRNEGDWMKYEVLPRFANAMGSIMNSNSDCERMFSFHTRIGRDPARNAMSQEMFVCMYVFIFFKYKLQ